jgi:hypothetical protein
VILPALMQKIKRFFFSSAQKSLITYGFIGWTPLSTLRISGQKYHPERTSGQ